MTNQEAEDCLERGCPHNPWNDDVCGACAKQILDVLRQAGGNGMCRICTSRHHTTEDHIGMQAWSDDGGTLD